MRRWESPVVCSCVVGHLNDDDECPVLVGYLLDDADLVCRDSLSVQLQNAGSSVILGSSDAASP